MKKIFVIIIFYVFLNNSLTGTVYYFPEKTRNPFQSPNVQLQYEHHILPDFTAPVSAGQVVPEDITEVVEQIETVTVMGEGTFIFPPPTHNPYTGPSIIIISEGVMKQHPSNNSVVDSLDIEFNWDAFDNAVYYNFFLSKTPYSESNLLTVRELTDSRYRLSEVDLTQPLTYETRYIWFVVALNSDRKVISKISEGSYYVFTTPPEPVKVEEEISDTVVSNGVDKIEIYDETDTALITDADLDDETDTALISDADLDAETDTPIITDDDDDDIKPEVESDIPVIEEPIVVTVRNVQLNNRPANSYDRIQKFIRDDLIDGRFTLTANVSGVKNIQQILLSLDGGRRFVEIPFSKGADESRITYNWTPSRDAEYELKLMIKLTNGETIEEDYFNPIYRIVYKNTTNEMLIKDLLDHLIRSILRSDHSAFMECISRDFTGSNVGYTDYSEINRSIREYFQQTSTINCSYSNERINVMSSDRASAEFRFRRGIRFTDIDMITNIDYNVHLDLIKEEGDWKIFFDRSNVLFARYFPSLPSTPY